MKVLSTVQTSPTLDHIRLRKHGGTDDREIFLGCMSDLIELPRSGKDPVRQARAPVE